MKKQSPGWMAMVFLVVPVLGLAALLPDPAGFPFWRGGAYSDLLISHWPIAGFIRHSITTWHQLPLWNPLILGGMPMTADPLAGLWYAPNAIAWINTSGIGFSALFWAHLGFAACGVLWLLRSEGASRPAALLGAIAFAATPKLIGHVGLGHLTLVEAVCWTPWILLAIRSAIDGALEPSGRLWRFGVSGALVGLTFLIDPRWLIPAALLAIAYAGKCLAHSQPREGRLGLGRGLVACLFGLGVAAPALLPLLELLPRTTRWGMTSGAAEDMSLAPTRILGALLFDGGGWPEAQTYVGATVILLIAAGAAASLRRGRFWTVTLVVSLVLALGSFTPLSGWLMRIVPGMSLMRVPARFYFIVALAAAMLAGHALDRLLDVASDSGVARRVRLVTVGFSGLALALPVFILLVRAGQSGALDPAASWACLAGGILTCAAAGCVLVILARTRAARAASVVLVTLIALDLASANLFTLRVEPAEAALSTRACEPAGEPAAYGTRRIFSPSYSVPQQAAERCGLELADGVNPLQLAAYRDAMASAVGFSTDSYSVTLPPFPGGDVLTDWHPALDADALGRLNVDRVISAYPLVVSDLDLLTEQDGQWVYSNPQVRPRAWVAPADGADSEWRPVSELEWTPNRIQVRANGPGRLVLSEIAYPGWQAQVDGSPVPVETQAGLLRAVELPTGEHSVVLAFVPGAFYGGCVLGLLALLGLLVLKVRR